jgi:hypothetical protein
VGVSPAASPAAPWIWVNENAFDAADAGEPSGRTVAETAAASAVTATAGRRRARKKDMAKPFYFKGFQLRGMSFAPAPEQNGAAGSPVRRYQVADASL